MGVVQYYCKQFLFLLSMVVAGMQSAKAIRKDELIYKVEVTLIVQGLSVFDMEQLT